MKIGLVCPYNINRGGAVLEIVKDLRSGFVALGHEVKIITPMPRDIGTADIEDMIFIGAGTDVRSPTHTTFQFSASVDTDAIDEMLEREKFDVLHFHEPWVPVLSRQILTRSKAVNIATFHGAVPETLMSRTVIKVVTPYATSILKYLHVLTAVSDPAAVYIKSLTDDPVIMIPNGIDLERFTKHPHETSRGRRKILYVGRLERRKGVKYLLQAYRLLTQTEENVELIIAGGGPDQEKLEMLAEDLKLEHVKFLGYVPDAEKMKLFRQADLFCAPAIYGESFGIILLEAMASGAVTVAANNSGYESVLKGLGQLSIVNPRDEDEFARRMHMMLNETELRKLWIDWSSEYVKQFAYPEIISRYEQLFKQALKAKKPVPSKK